MFDPKALVRQGAQSPVAAGRLISKFLYATPDTAATAETAGYFTDKRLRKGDQIDATMVVDGTPVRKNYVVTAVSTTGAATVALQTATAG